MNSSFFVLGNSLETSQNYQLKEKVHDHFLTTTQHCCRSPEEGQDGGGGIGITANTKVLGHYTANSKNFAVLVKINKRIKIYTKTARP